MAFESIGSEFPIHKYKPIDLKMNNRFDVFVYRFGSSRFESIGCKNSIDWIKPIDLKINNR